MIVAIDGPAGAGKSTVARALAERLGFALPRHRRDVPRAHLARARARRRPSTTAPRSPRSPARTRSVRRPARSRSPGRDVTEAIREPRIDRAVSSVARHGEVRAVMRERQRELAARGDAVVEGRDIGTVVCPDAEVKVYLVADAAERARRRRVERGRGGRRHGRGADRLRDERDAAQMAAGARRGARSTRPT